MSQRVSDLANVEKPLEAGCCRVLSPCVGYCRLLPGNVASHFRFTNDDLRFKGRWRIVKGGKSPAYSAFARLWRIFYF